MVFAERGINGTVIDHVVRRAGVSRGTFYNYFETIDDLLKEAKLALGCEMVTLIHAADMPGFTPPERVASALRAFIEISQTYPLFLDFTAQLGHQADGFGTVLHEIAPKFFCDGISSGMFEPVSETMVIDILEAGTISLLRRITEGKEVDVTQFIAAMLRVLGVTYDDSARMAMTPAMSPNVPSDSLLERSNAAWLRSRVRTAVVEG